MEYRDFINTNMNDVITALNGSITPAPVNSELYRDFLNRKADDVITALNGSITPAPAGDELYRDFIERKFDDVIAGIGSYVPPVTFPTLTGSIVTFNSQYALPLKSHKIALTATQSGSGTPSPDNVRTINGVSAIHIQNTAGINQWDEQWRNGYYTTSGQFQSYSSNIANKNKIRVLPNTSYYFKCDGGSFGRVCWYDKDGTFISTAVFQQANVISTSPNNAYYLNFDMVGAYGNTYKNDISINPSTDTSYHAFVGQSITVQIGSTVYGGEYDARTGVLKVTYAVIVYDGSNDENWGVQGIAGFWIDNTAKKIGRGNYLADNYQATDLSGWDISTPNGYFSGHPTLPRLYFRTPYDGFEVTLDNWRSWLSSNPVTVVYELATPQTIQLPPCPIDTIANSVNNIWADTGDTTLQYIKIGGNT